MALTDTWQLPSGDDIDSDSLEYLFARKRQRGEAPWVKIAREPEPVARISPEMIRLQAKLETVSGQLEIFANKLSRASHELGYVRAQLAERDQQLELQAEYRARAALSIMSDVERRQMQERISQLEEQLQAVLRHPPTILSAPLRVEQSAQAPADLPVPGEPVPVAKSAASWQDPLKSGAHNLQLEAALVRHAPASGRPSIMLMPIIYLLMLTCAALVLLRLAL